MREDALLHIELAGHREVTEIASVVEMLVRALKQLAALALVGLSLRPRRSGSIRVKRLAPRGATFVGERSLAVLLFSGMNVR